MADDNGPDHKTAARLRVLHRFIATLEPPNRALLLLYLDERSTREIAEVLGISESNVTTKISRLRQRIRHPVAAPGNEYRSNHTSNYQHQNTRAPPTTRNT